MSLPTVPQSPTTSPDPVPDPPVMRPEGWAEGQCWIIGCVRNIGVWIPISQIAPSAMPVLFGLPSRPLSYDEWERYPAFAGVCQRHYTGLRTKHGTVLAYSMRGGKPSAYVADRLF